jgi:predicted methyltransferase
MERLWSVHQLGHNLGGEADLIERTLNHVETDDIIWDIGSGWGMWTLAFAKASPETTVIAFEPDESRCRSLTTQAEMNEVADRIRLQQFAIDNGRKGVRGDTLDLPSPDIVKIDIEGAELRAINGMVTKLRHARYALVEVHLRSGVTIGEIIDPLTDVFDNVQELRRRGDVVFIEAKDVESA